MQRFIEESVRSGVPAELYQNTKMAGPLATFNGADNWVEHPYSNGIVLMVMRLPPVITFQPRAASP
jgi:hypothetical protein